MDMVAWNVVLNALLLGLRENLKVQPFFPHVIPACACDLKIKQMCYIKFNHLIPGSEGLTYPATIISYRSRAIKWRRFSMHKRLRGWKWCSFYLSIVAPNWLSEVSGTNLDTLHIHVGHS